MPPLETLIHQWRESMRKNLDPDAIEELEQHLRETIVYEMSAGKSHTEAFHLATKQLGAGETINAEFDKISAMDWWAVKATFGFWIFLILIGSVVALRFNDRQYGWILVPHVIGVTLGYLGTYLCGALGIAFVIERFFSGFNYGRLSAAARAAMIYSGIAAIPTAFAIVLGMIWAKLAWGRYWAWDAKETGAFGVLVWQILFYFAGRAKMIPARVVMLLAIFGNIVVSLGWFGANRSYNILVPVIAAHLVFLIAGLMNKVGPDGRAPSQV